MDHLCYIDHKEEEYQKLLNGESSKLIRFTRRNKPPFRYVFKGDRVFFVNKYEEIILRGEAKEVINLDILKKSEQKRILLENIDGLSISMRKIKQLKRSKHVIIIDLCNVQKVKIKDFPQKGLVKRSKWILVGCFQRENENG